MRLDRNLSTYLDTDFSTKPWAVWKKRAHIITPAENASEIPNIFLLARLAQKANPAPMTVARPAAIVSPNASPTSLPVATPYGIQNKPVAFERTSPNKGQAGKSVTELLTASCSTLWIYYRSPALSWTYHFPGG